MVVQLCLVYAGFMIITLIAVSIMRAILLSDINQTYKEAVTSAYNIILNSFKSQTIDIMLISLLIALTAWLTDKYHLIDKARAYISKKKNTVQLQKRPYQKINNKDSLDFIE